MKNYNRSIARATSRHEVSIVSRQMCAHVSSPILLFSINSFYQEIHLLHTNGKKRLHVIYTQNWQRSTFNDYFSKETDYNMIEI